MWNWNWRVGRVFGIPLHLHWTLLFIPLYYFFQIRSEAWQWWVWIGAGLAAHFLFILVHELGHCWASLRSGGSAERILLWPLGGFAYVGHTDNPRTDFFVAASGPATHLVWVAVLGGALALVGGPWTWHVLNPVGNWWDGLELDRWPGWIPLFLLNAIYVNVAVFAFNVFVPAVPLDGGRMLLDVLSMRMGPGRAMRTSAAISLPIGVVMVVVAVLQGNLFLGFIGVMVILQAMQTRAIVGEDESFSPHGYSDRGYRYAERRPEGFFARRRRERREREEARRAAEILALRRRVDELLEKVSREGMGSLTPPERKALEEASERLKGSE